MNDAQENIEELEKVFKKRSPALLDGPYIPLPTFLVKAEGKDELEGVIEKGAMAFSIGDYGDALTQFAKVVRANVMPHAKWFYIVKTMMMLDLEIQKMKVIEHCDWKSAKVIKVK